MCCDETRAKVDKRKRKVGKLRKARSGVGKPV